MNDVERTRRIVLAILCHVFVFAVLIVGAIALDHLLIAAGDPKLYDLVPWRYLVDTGDLGLTLGFIVYGTISFIVLLKGSDQ